MKSIGGIFIWSTLLLSLSAKLTEEAVIRPLTEKSLFSITGATTYSVQRPSQEDEEGEEGI